MNGRANDRARPAWWSLLVLVAVGALALAAPASAGKSQEANVSQSCNAGDSDDSSSSGSGDCGNQRRVVQQSAGGSVSRSINQSQSFGGDDDPVRVKSDPGEDDVEDDFKTEESSSVSSQSTECEDFSTQGDAQAALEDGSADSSGLDADDDGRACEEEFTQEVSGAPEGGVETGGGGTLPHPGEGFAAQVARLAGPPLALALLVGGLLGLRRGRIA